MSKKSAVFTEDQVITDGKAVYYVLKATKKTLTVAPIMKKTVQDEELIIKGDDMDGLVLVPSDGIDIKVNIDGTDLKEAKAAAKKAAKASSKNSDDGGDDDFTPEEGANAWIIVDGKPCKVEVLKVTKKKVTVEDEDEAEIKVAFAEVYKTKKAAKAALKNADKKSSGKKSSKKGKSKKTERSCANCKFFDPDGGDDCCAHYEDIGEDDTAEALTCKKYKESK